jgi:triosephosphate isomerase
LEILENNKKKSFLLNQLQTFCKDNISPDLLAYEPIWAIGTGKEADSENIASAVSIILSFLKKRRLIVLFCMAEVSRKAILKK